MKPALSGISIRIKAKSTVGIVGTTGSGKSTLVDIVLGLLEPEKGRLLVDGNAITMENCRQWQRSIGYVPQHIYLTDDTIAANIAFGVEPIKVDENLLKRASIIANLHKFVMNDLPEGYLTRVGERGIRLSGGQRQRIGIARALYHNPSLLIFDEATSALDNVTEKDVMDAVGNIANEITVILIAHRLTTVRQCDVIYLLESGVVEAYGTYDELMLKSSTFREMVMTSKN